MQVEVKKDFEIKNMTTFKVGGKVKNVFLPKNQQEFVSLLNELKDYIILGNCSNVLISSNGYSGNIILTTEMRYYLINGTKVYASCGVKGPLLAQETCRKSLTGFEFMIGFPGTIGGEIYMNASAHGQAVSDNLVSCCLFNKKTKEIVYKNKSEMDFSYRHSLLQNNEYVLLGAEFELKKANHDDIKDLIHRNLAFRKNVQPTLVNPNAGSVFKNPENDSAGRLLDKAGVKELVCDNVKVWDKHANFIVNTGCATSENILELMCKMKQAVKDTYTIDLTPEIIFVGDKTKKEEELCKILYQKTQK
ncbi:MAG: UDP-N-acetylmuramate dehydrogenase [bacterium]|nr:UDP-N-acetylmuramate dehydrogenase [bacterium]